MSKKKKSNKFPGLMRVRALLTLICFGVVTFAGLQAGASLGTVLWRATLVTLLIAVAFRILIQILVTSEEMERG